MSGIRVDCCDEHVCLSVCLCSHTSQEPDAQAQPDFLRTLPMAMAWFIFGRVVASHFVD